MNAGSVVDGDGNPDEMEVFDMVNTERAKAGVGPLAWCDGLYACAKAHSNDMCERGFFDHTNPEGEGPSERAQYGHAGRFTFAPIVPDPYSWGVAENIAYGYTTPAEVMNGWMNSSGHRANILNGSYTHIGVGQCDGCLRHWTQNFGTR
ncbi:MAG: CAP domain-containing protein [Planctomycetota bacterium]|nr:MAG: CAP domain-containing protein [Planctomycetota bacterium]